MHNEKGIPIEQLVDSVEKRGNLEELSQLILKLYEQNDDQALKYCIRLALFDYDVPSKAEYHNLGIIGALHWGVTGIKQLGEAAIRISNYYTRASVALFLSHLSSKSLPYL